MDFKNFQNQCFLEWTSSWEFSSHYYVEAIWSQVSLFLSDARRVTLQTAESKLINQATFYRKAVGNPATKDVESSQSNCSLQSTVSNEPFKFNFSAAGSGDPLVANTDTNKQCTDSNTVVDKCNIAPQQVAADGVSDISATVSAMNINHNSQETALSNPCLNYYKMETTGGQGFSFNFTNPNETWLLNKLYFFKMLPLLISSHPSMCTQFFNEDPGPFFNIKTVFPGVESFVIEIKQSWDHLIFITGNHILGRWHLDTETPPCCFYIQAEFILENTKFICLFCHFSTLKCCR